MSLRYALLALLRTGPLSGYDLQKQFSVSVGHVWHAPDSQIYLELRRMRDEGLVQPEEQVRGERGTRILYHVTDDGEATFLAWMDSPLEYQRVRDPAHLRAAYLESATPEQAEAFLRAHVTQWQQELSQWQGELKRIDAHDNPMLMRRLAATPESEHERTIAYKRFAYEGLVDRATTEIEWAKRGLALVRRLSG